MQFPVFRAYWRAMTGWVRRIPSSLIRMVAATALVTGVLVGIVVVVSVAIPAGLTVFVGVVSSPVTAVMAFQPYAVGAVHVDPVEAQQARQDILSDSRNPLRCVSSVDMKSAARPVMAIDGNGESAASEAAGVALGVEPIQVTDSTAAVLPEIEQTIATIPRGSEFFEAYAFVITALNGGVDSWNRFVSVTAQMHLGTPINSADAMDTAKVFFTPDSDLSVTEALSAAVMLRLASSRIVNGRVTTEAGRDDAEQQAGQLLETAVNHCT